MLLVLGGVAGDRLVAELRQLDPHLVPRRCGSRRCRRPPSTAATARAAAATRRSRRAGRATLLHRVGERRAARRAGRAPGPRRSRPTSVGEREREQEPGGDLRVERLGRRDAHLDVAAVGRVEHAVGLVDEVAVAAVDDRDHRRAAGPREVDGAVGVGGGAALADRDDERVAHVVAAGRTPTARWRAPPRPDERADRAPRAARPRGSARDRRGALPDHDHPVGSARRAALARASSAASRGRARPRAGRRRRARSCRAASCGTTPAPRRSPSAGSAGSRPGRCRGS